ncbi:HlyD family secretion protein [Psychromonas algicola]|uniref:HlyD family secretion protein n=1 Tax=Psychromonas algicola TaxID=2555642 RepID=UPI001067FF2E|nr:efflux RND transporter periplasmic adaptor subunit [Psychromonas sp. RZ5]TEW51521.1 HlyD family efflux transporter periplasmic adaptor subunit [Psychromonas sp. RZ5]
MKSVKPFLISLIVLVIVSFIGYRFYLAYLPQPVRLQGQIEAQQYTISSKIAGRIDQVLVKKGDLIKKGDPIFTILSPEIEAKLEQAIANKDAASAMALQSQSGTRVQEINAARDQWKKAQAATELMEKTFQRVESLYKDGVVAEQKRDEALTQWEASKYTESAALQMYKMAEEGARSETKIAAAEKVKMAEGAVAEVRAYAQDTKITSWFNGEVSQVLLNSGELAPQGFPVVTVVDMQDVWAVFNVREDLLSQFNKGRHFKAYLPALNKSIEFEVTHVAVMGDFATWRTTDASQGFDLRTFEVEARPVNSTSEFRVGMSVTVEL